ncbi:MAG TPA: hypothetical protein VF719_13575 [Abditibacteriaceae bacterium]
MEQTMELAKQKAIEWLALYGDMAVVPALLLDATGVPWLWIFLMLLAEKAGKNIWVLLIYGTAVMTAFDHLMYGIGALGGRRLLRRVGHRFPKVSNSVVACERAIQGRAGWAVTIGRFLPLVGRYVGIAAALVGMSYARFAVLDFVGVAITVIGFGLLAHFVGEKTLDQPWFAEALGYFLIAGIVLTVAFLAWQYFRSRGQSTAEFNDEHHDETEHAEFAVTRNTSPDTTL